MSTRLGIIGSPVSHSLSPVIQSAALHAAGINASYYRWETPLEDLSARVASLRKQDCLGANVTIPYKQTVLPFLDEVVPLAAEIGAVNTIVNNQGQLIGYNTDGSGFLAALEESGFSVAGKRFLLVGAGGASRGIAFALRQADAGLIAISNRTADRAEALAESVGARPVPFGHPVSLYDCVVNCTSVGMQGSDAGAALPYSLTTAKPSTLVVDIVYTPEETGLIKAARAAGLTCLGGLPMLIHQGALAFELWTGKPAPIDTMREAAQAVLSSSEHES